MAKSPSKNFRAYFRLTDSGTASIDPNQCHRALVCQPANEMKRKVIAVTSAPLIGLTAVAAFVMVMTTSAHAQAIPNLPIEELCRATSNPNINPLAATGDTKGAFAQCLQSERGYRKELEKQWGNFAQAEKQHCVSLAQMGGGSASYAELITCLEMARDVRKSKNSSANGESKEYRKR